MQEVLSSEGLRLSAVQNHYSLLNRSSETSGILDYCRENGIGFFAYMVLEQGALTGRYGSAHPFPEGSARAEAYNPILGEMDGLIEDLRRVGTAHGISAAQAAIAWAVSKGVIPIVGVTKPSQVEEAAAAADVQLTEDEIGRLEDMASKVDASVIRFWEKEMV